MSELEFSEKLGQLVADAKSDGVDIDIIISELELEVERLNEAAAEDAEA